MINVIPGALLPVVVTLVLGMLAGWHRDQDVGAARSLNHMVLTYALPLALFAGWSLVKATLLVSARHMRARTFSAVRWCASLAAKEGHYG